VGLFEITWDYAIYLTYFSEIIKQMIVFHPEFSYNIHRKDRIGQENEQGEALRGDFQE
jgi:hypothetical protein